MLTFTFSYIRKVVFLVLLAATFTGPIQTLSSESIFVPQPEAVAMLSSFADKDISIPQADCVGTQCDGG